MRNWAAGLAVAAVLGTTSVVLGYEGQTPQQHQMESTELLQLRAKLAEREAQVQSLQQKVAQLEEADHLGEAERLGVLQAVAQSGLPARQQKRLAVAIVREAKRNGVDPMLVVAIIRCESSFNNYAVSGVGAMGLMQVMPDTGSFLADRAGWKLGRPTNLFDSELNVELGTAYVAELIARFGSVEKALVAYNAGPALAKRILAKPDARKRFLAGYPKKVVAEFRKLKAKQESELTLRAEKATDDSNG
ncbi:lytic transglycosylase domain-containing protein [Aggregicoccus sp. 17bor-14]|uniref:lytic transglycosylase domain-containing protein n=1 Tax=Myxococcaceae TaxID=31 RepID=UPI00129C8149|nr:MULTISPECIES: lytic transglycosylase domain-containing protein [Myxococcaceae]MBF5044037.1 lytic transglycosylase domain-containing protein [Simulacricoccus sp. 17bor-14]MRI89788.1 lytic transglycosylase domain-containing protein [Aggregicoccus sp. 17bor-14]